MIDTIKKLFYAIIALFFGYMILTFIVRGLINAIITILVLGAGTYIYFKFLRKSKDSSS